MGRLFVCLEGESFAKDNTRFEKMIFYHFLVGFRTSCYRERQRGAGRSSVNISPLCGRRLFVIDLVPSSPVQTPAAEVWEEKFRPRGFSKLHFRAAAAAMSAFLFQSQKIKELFRDRPECIPVLLRRERPFISRRRRRLRRSVCCTV